MVKMERKQNRGIKMERKNLATILCATIAVSAFSSCSKLESNTGKPALEATTREKIFIQVQNTTNSEVVQVSETNYIVLPPATVIKTMSLANEPIKSICRSINKLNHAITNLKEKQVEVAALVETDFSYEGAVDELAAEINAKNVELDKEKDKTFEVKVTYSKEQLLKNVETLKAANPDLVFEMAQPSQAQFSAKNAKGETQAVQSLSLNDKITEGAFDQTPSDVKMSFNVNHDVLCTLRNLKAKEDKKAVLELGFQK